MPSLHLSTWTIGCEVTLATMTPTTRLRPSWQLEAIKAKRASRVLLPPMPGLEAEMFFASDGTRIHTVSPGRKLGKPLMLLVHGRRQWRRLETDLYLRLRASGAHDPPSEVRIMPDPPLGHKPAPSLRPSTWFSAGFPETWYSWRYQMAAFKDKYDVVAFDMRYCMYVLYCRSGICVQGDIHLTLLLTSILHGIVMVDSIRGYGLSDKPKVINI
jgi:hypothetical protein